MITDEAKKKRLEYQRAYRERNREKIKAYQRDWHKANPEKNKEYVERHWNKVAEGAKQNNGIIGNGETVNE